MGYNVTIDDISPLIKYDGSWLDSYNLTAYNITEDPHRELYLDSTFHSTQADGASASVTFNGTAIYIFGAKRGNHGNYTVTVDNGEPDMFDGYAPMQGDADGVYKALLFNRTNLGDGLHTVVLTNSPRTDTSRPFVDIDFITWTSSHPPASKKITIDDSHWNYTDLSQWVNPGFYENYFNDSEHRTDVEGATASVEFEGNAVYFYGGTLDNHGMFRVQIDDHKAVKLNGSTNGYHDHVLMYYADGLGPGMHKLTVTNLEQGKFLDVDYIEIVPFRSSKAKTPVIAGIICGVVIGLAWIVALVWWFMRRRRRNSELVDLLEPEVNPYDVPPAGYVAGSGPGWSAQHLPYTFYPQHHPQLAGAASEVVPQLNRKGRPQQVQPTNARRNMNEERLISSRMHVPEQPQGWGLVSDTGSTESTEMMLPPNYHQAIGSFPTRRSQP